MGTLFFFLKSLFLPGTTFAVRPIGTQVNLCAGTMQKAGCCLWRRRALPAANDRTTDPVQKYP